MKRALLLTLALAAPAMAIIPKVYPLKGVIQDSDSIHAVEVKSRDAKAGVVTLVSRATLKGQGAFSPLRVEVKEVPNGRADEFLKRMKPGKKAVIFSKAGRFSYGYGDEGWFMIQAPAEGSAAWKFSHLDGLMNRTYNKGTAADLTKIVRDVLAGRAEAPAPDPRAKL